MRDWLRWKRRNMRARWCRLMRHEREEYVAVSYQAPDRLNADGTITEGEHLEQRGSRCKVHG